MIRIGDFFPVLYADLHRLLIPEVINILVFLSPIVLVFILGITFFPLYVDYVRSMNFLKIKYTVLEIKLPIETFKSPLAMELFFHALHNTSDGSNFAQYWKGETRPWYSLEIVSIEGSVKFMIWTEDQRKNGVMSSLYAQFPGIEVQEVEDYAKSVHFDEKTMKMFACQFEFTKPDPYPIKTYVDYGLDKDPKEEFKVDPLVPVLEFLGSIGPNQQIWMQILIRAHKGEQTKAGHLFKKTDDWKDQAQEEINKILVRDPKTKVAGQVGEDGAGQRVTISPGEQDVVKAIERSITKLPFDVGIRWMYLSKRESFDTPFGIGGIMSSMKHFNTEHLNGFKPSKKWIPKLGEPWHDYKNVRRNKISKDFLLAYKLRSYFYTPYESKSMVLNTEELATIFHFPGSTALTPTLERIPSKKSQAPANLPL